MKLKPKSSFVGCCDGWAGGEGGLSSFECIGVSLGESPVLLPVLSAISDGSDGSDLGWSAMVWCDAVRWEEGV